MSDDVKNKDNTKKDIEDTTNDAGNDGAVDGSDAGSDKDASKGDDKTISDSHPLVKQLRKENGKKRIEIGQLRDRIAMLEAEKNKTGNQSTDDVKKTEQTDTVLKEVNKRYIRAELKAEALKAGLVDIDALRMFDTSTLEINESGDVVGVADLIDEMKVSKPYLFQGYAKDTSSDKKTPGADKITSKNALDMSDEEFAASARDLGIHVDNFNY